MVVHPKDGMTSSISFSWIVALTFGLQIFFDFEGYSCIARGLAYIFGFTFPKNFNYPYLARSYKEFWSRWHITLSTWFRDYVYISLGGNRSSKFRTARNLLITMAIAGIWHGASWTFLYWGLIHGVLLIFERALNMQHSKVGLFPGLFWRLFVFVTIIYSWVWFRSDTAHSA